MKTSFITYRSYVYLQRLSACATCQIAQTADVLSSDVFLSRFFKARCGFCLLPPHPTCTWRWRRLHSVPEKTQEKFPSSISIESDASSIFSSIFESYTTISPRFLQYLQFFSLDRHNTATPAIRWSSFNWSIFSHLFAAINISLRPQPLMFPHCCDTIKSQGKHLVSRQGCNVISVR